MDLNLTFITANQTINTGEEITLLCNAVGIPAPQVSWSRAKSKTFDNVDGQEYEVSALIIIFLNIFHHNL